MRRGLLVYNPAAGGQRFRSRVPAVIARARAGGLELEPCPTTAPGAATHLITRALASPPDVIAAAGGDGTVRECAAALIGSPVPLGILPAGTANVLAREYGIGVDLGDAVRTLLSRRTRPLTAWSAPGHSCFMWMGIGLDARVMRNTIPLLKRTLGRAGIAWTAVSEWMHYDFPAIGVEGTDARGAPFAREATFVVASNISRYGGDAQLSARADPGDDLLDLTLFTGRTPRELLRFATDVAFGRIRSHGVANAEQFTVRSMTARALGAAPVDVQVDGDHVGTTPAAVGPPLGHVMIIVPA